MKAPNTLIYSLILALYTGSCIPFSPDVRDSPEGEIPKVFSVYTAETKHPDRWWEAFNAPELKTLIDEAFSGNFTLKEAWARLNQARALALQAGADLYPDLTGGAAYSYARQKTENSLSTTRRTQKDYSIGLQSSYELDLWGKIRSQREAARLSAEATREDLNTAAITLAAEVAQRWANIISQRMQKNLLENQLQTNLTFLELVELRFRKSMVSALDIYQQKQIVEKTKAEIPLVEQEEQLLLHELALLLGKPPRAKLVIQQPNLPHIPPDIPDTGLPADLLAARPDIRAAGLRLYAADWQVSAARANRLPAISLTGGADFSADHMDLIFDNWLLSLAGNLTAPIFDGYRRASEVDRTRAVADENLWIYRETVLTAIKEVEDAVVRETKQREYIEGLELQIDAARKALEQATERYRKGITEYLPVLTQLLSVQGLERNLIQQRTILVIDRISVYRALGGTWTDDLAVDG